MAIGGNSTVTVSDLLGYNPNSGAAVFMGVVFAVWSLIICIQCVRTRSWFMMSAVIAGAFEAVGFGARYLVAQKNDLSIGPYVISTLLLLVAPNGLALVNYSLLGRCININQLVEKDVSKPAAYSFLRIPCLMDEYRRIIPHRVARIFFLSDIACMVIQFMGGIMTGDTESADNRAKGAKLVTAGFAVQFCFYGLYCLIGLQAYFTWRAFAISNSKALLIDHSVYPIYQLRQIYLLLCSSIVLLFIRNTYRMLEANGNSAATHEAVFYLFDPVVILGWFLLYTVLPPGNSLPIHPIVGRESSQSGENAGIDKDQIKLSPGYQQDMDLEAVV